MPSNYVFFFLPLVVFGCAHPTQEISTSSLTIQDHETLKVVFNPKEDGGHWTGDAPETGDITETVVCGGHQKVQLTGRTFHVKSRPALMTGGSCEIVLTDCVIVDENSMFGEVTAVGNANVQLHNVKILSDIGMFAAGNATLEFWGGSITAQPAIAATGAAAVTLHGTVVDGDVETRELSVVDRDP